MTKVVHSGSQPTTRWVPASMVYDEKHARTQLHKLQSTSSEKLNEIFVGRLDNEILAEHIWKHFEQIAPVKNVHMGRDLRSSKLHGYAFVRFRDGVSAEKVLFEDPDGKGHVINGHHVNVQRVRNPYIGGSRCLRSIFVAGLDNELTAREMWREFSQFGPVQSLQLSYVSGPTVTYNGEELDFARYQHMNHHHGFAFVTYKELTIVDELIRQRFIPIGGRTAECTAIIPRHINTTIYNIRDKLNDFKRGSDSNNVEGSGKPNDVVMKQTVVNKTVSESSTLLTGSKVTSSSPIENTSPEETLKRPPIPKGPKCHDKPVPPYTAIPAFNLKECPYYSNMAYTMPFQSMYQYGNARAMAMQNEVNPYQNGATPCPTFLNQTTGCKEEEVTSDAEAKSLKCPACNLPFYQPPGPPTLMYTGYPGYPCQLPYSSGFDISPHWYAAPKLYPPFPV